MSNLVALEQKPIETKNIDWSKDQVARMWIEASLRLRTVERPEIMREVADAMGKKPAAIKTWFYRHLAPNNFEQYWMDRYQAHYRMRLGPKTYARMNDLVDKEKDLDKLVNVLDHIEGKQEGPTVQINQFIKTEKEQYGI